MEGFKFGNTKKTNNGVSKNSNSSNRFTLFFQVFFRKFWNLIFLNAIYMIACIPIVTIGPATAAFTKVMRSYTQERPVSLLSDFFDAFKKNFKQSFVIGIVDAVLIAVSVVSILYYANMTNKSSSYSILLVCAFVAIYILVMMHFYIYLMIVSTNLKMGEIIKNSLIFAIVGIKTNLITFVAVMAIIIINVLFFPFSMLLAPLFPFSFIGFIVCFNSYPVIRKYVIQPYYDQIGELNPEFEYLVGSESEKKTFVDKA